MPITIHTMSRSHVSIGSPAISASATSAESAGTNGTSGVRNGRWRSGFLYRSTMIPIDTMTKASSVPMLTRWPRMSIRVNPAASATATPVTMVVMCGVRNRGWIFLAHPGSSPSLAIE